DFSKNNGQYGIDLELNKFNFDFLKFFFNFQDISFSNLFLSGSSEFLIGRNNSVEKLLLNLSVDGKLSYSTFQGVEKLKLKESKIFGEKKLDNIDIIFSISHLETLFKFVFRIDLKEKNFSKVLFELDKIKVSELIRIWPKDFEKSVYSWMKPNVRGEISDFIISSEILFQNDKLDFGNPKGKFDFSNVEIRYMDSMPLIKEIDGDAKINGYSILFNISKGISKNLSVQNGEVELYDLDTDIEKAKVDLKIFSKNSDVIDYLDYSIINKNSYTKLRKIEGDTLVDLHLNFPLLLDLIADDINYSSKVSIENAIFSDLFNAFSLEDFKINIEIDRKMITYNGQGAFLKSLVKFDGKQLSKENRIIDQIEGFIQMSSNSIELLLPDNEMKFNGNIGIDFSIYEDDKKSLKIEGVGDLNKLSLNSNFLGPNLDFKDGKIVFLIRPFDNKYSGFFDLKAKNLSIEVNSLFIENKILELNVLKLESPLQDFGLIYKNNENRFEISGRKLTLEKIDISKDNEFKLDDINFNLEVGDFVIGTRNFYNSKISFMKSNGFFSNFNFSLKGDEDFHKISINDEVYHKKFVLESNYIPGLLEIFDIDLNINKGSLKIEGNKATDSSEYVGSIAGKDLVFFDAPLFADFFSIFSLEGFAQKMKDGGIIFSTFNADYKFSNQKLKIVDSLLKGSELGIQFDSVIGLEDDYFLMNGSIIPAYTINTLITKFPIVGDIITAGSPEDGLIGANFRVEKIDGEYEVFYNPISVFVPNIIKNFLGN
ncbi:MAG: DUF3971 domain-containing protein, partial [Pseudomonadota bacterium]|nr:DUF3971 domain-containing protein [Pseudomonadota bacterium]